MARLQLTIQTVVITGKDIGAGQAVLLADGAQFQNGDNTILKVENTSAGVKTITFVTPITVGDEALAVADQAVAIPAGPSTIRYVGLFKGSIYNQISGADAGQIYVDVSADGLTVTAIAS